jgi:formylglycine-generating enzyme required for sulfatase activity
VEQVSWYNAMEFCARLSAHTERPYRLPSEAEWEYACRAGTTTPFYVGKTLTTDVANYNGDYTYADGPKGEYRAETTPVDHFGLANAFGLCDMHGNVWEWCQDYWHDSYEGAPTDGSAWIEGGDSERRILRGGSWYYFPWFCRSAYRSYFGPGFVVSSYGFRVVCSAPRALQRPTG